MHVVTAILMIFTFGFLAGMFTAWLVDAAGSKT